MRFVDVRSLENPAALMRHKTREMLVSQRTQLFNGLRGHLTEVGVIAAHPRAGGQISRIIPVRPNTAGDGDSAWLVTAGSHWIKRHLATMR